MAVKHWAGGTNVRVGVIGSGEEAREGLRALAGAVRVTQAAVFSPTQNNREAFATEMTAELDLEVLSASSQLDAIAGCEVVYVATSSHNEPLLRAEDVGGVGILAAIGSTQPIHRELAGGVFLAAARTVVDTPDATHESGDCIEAASLGWAPSAALLLGDYLRQDPATNDGLTIFKSIGSVEQDLVLAHHLLVSARESQNGVLVQDVASLRVMR